MSSVDNNRPFSVILGDELKPFLHQIAHKEKRSIGYVIRQILLDYKKAKENVKGNKTGS